MKDILCGRSVGVRWARGLGRASRVGRGANIKALLLTWLYYSAWTSKDLPTLVKPPICGTLCRWVSCVVFCRLVNIKNHWSSVSTCRLVVLHLLAFAFGIGLWGKATCIDHAWGFLLLMLLFLDWIRSYDLVKTMDMYRLTSTLVPIVSCSFVF